jgi:hypothetical protein
LWLTEDDLQDPSSWFQAQSHVGSNDGLISQDGVSQQKEDATLTIPQLNRLHESYIVWGEDVSNVDVTVIPAQNKVNLQILSMWSPFKDLKQTFVVSHCTEQFRLRVNHHVVTTVETSVLRTEMTSLTVWSLKRRMSPDSYFGLNQ